jgi:ABC-type Mn2+/Zn2+ transport system ATPase subunit
MTDVSGELIRLERVEIGYQKALLPPLDVVIRAGERTAILGPNGAGKSSLLRTIIGTLPVLGGKIVHPRGRRPILGYVPQSHQPDPAFPLTTHDVVLMGRYPALGVARRPRTVDHEATSRQIALVGLAAQEQVLFRQLSGGQRQRALVARAMVGAPELLVLDEPTSELDPAAEHALLHLVDRLAADHQTCVLFVTHQISAAAGFASQVILINHHAGLVESGPVAELLTSPKLSQLYGIPIEVARQGGRLLVWMASDTDEARL